MPPRREPSTRIAAPRTQSSANTARSRAQANSDVDKLADRLASGLSIKGKQRAVPPEDPRVTAMRTVNTVSKQLSVLIEKPSSRSTIKVVDARNALKVLRVNSTSPVDVERAASSLIGKLIALRKDEDALLLLKDMHPALAVLYHTGPCPASLTSLPFPPPSGSEVILSLISSYLVYSIQLSPLSILELDDKATLLYWIPYLPAKQLDGALTKAYSALSKAKELSKDPFRIQIYALKCLSHTSSDVLKEPSKFWAEVVNTVASSSSSIPARDILTALDDIVTLAQKRCDSETFFSGDSWSRVVDGWCSLAKQTGDVASLDRISNLLSPSAAHATSSSLTNIALLDEREVAQLSTLLAKLELSFSSPTDDALNLTDLTSAISNTKPFLSSLSTPTDLVTSTPNRRASEKIYRALERARRIACKTLESPSATQETKTRAWDTVLHISDVLTEISNPESRLQAAALDALFTLARVGATRALSEPLSTFEEPFSFLNRAQRMLRIDSSKSQSHTEPDHIRTLANAFYAISGTLYKASKYDFAVRFLERACELSSEALRLYDTCAVRDTDSSRKETETEGWSLLRETLYKRYEVLGVCHSKTGDRKAAYESFVKAICAFPYTSSKAPNKFAALDSQVVTLVDRVTYMGVCELFLDPKDVSLKTSMLPSRPASPKPQPATASASHVSEPMSSRSRNLKSSVKSKSKAAPKPVPAAEQHETRDDPLERWRTFTGSLIERQINSLEPSRYKPTVRRAVGVLILDALEVYDKNADKVKWANVLLMQLEHKYYEPTAEETEVEGIVKEIEELLSFTAGSPQSANLLIPQFVASAHLWHALHTHKRNDLINFPSIVVRAEQACKVLNPLLAQTRQSRPSQARFSLLPRSSLSTNAKRSPIHGRKVGSGSPLTRRVGVASPAPSKTKQLVVPAAPTKKGTRSRIAVSSRSRSGRAAVSTIATRGTRSTKTMISTSGNVDPKTPKSKLDPSISATDTANRVETTPGVIPSRSRTYSILPKLLDLLRMVSELLGLLGHAITRVHILSVIRRLCEHNMNTQPDDYVQASIDLAHEYVKLGKTRRAANVYSYVYNVAKNVYVKEETRLLFYLRYAELFGTLGNVLKGSSVYCDAVAAAERLLNSGEKSLSTAEKVKARVSTLQRAALAANTFAVIQYSKDDPTASLNGLLQSLRLYHRASDTLTRLSPPPPSSTKDRDAENPFDMTAVKTSLANVENDSSKPTPLDDPQQKSFPQRSSLSSLEFRIASGLLSTLFSLTQAYFARGSAREAEYFASQAHDLAESLHAPGMICRALSRMGEIKLRMGKTDEAHDCLSKAAVLVNDVGGVEAVDVARLRGEVLMKARMESGDVTNQAKVMYEEAIKMLEELDVTLSSLDGTSGTRKSLGASPKSPQQSRDDTLAPALLVAVLRQNIALLHDAGEEYKTLLERLRSLPPTSETKAEENALLAKLTLDDAYARFRADMFLSSLAESAISVPVGMTGGQFASSPTTLEILGTLNTAEKLFWQDLALVARRGDVSHVRGSVVSLALIKAFQTSMGKAGREGPTILAQLLDSSAAITLRREILETIQHKFHAMCNDDLQWPLLTPNGSILPPLAKQGPRVFSFDSEGEDDDETIDESKSLKSYWDFTASKYESPLYDPSALSSPQVDDLPPHWTIVSITLTSDENSLFLTRQRPNSEPLIFCVPLKNRREGDDEEEDKLTFQDALNELKEIIGLNDEGTRNAVKVNRNDKQARADWWAGRSELDKRMKNFLQNIEFCWLGAFKTVLSEPVNCPSEVLSTFRMRLEGIFKRTLLHSQKQHSHIRLSDTLLECFSTLSPTCESEELEDVAYFILDLYQFHGVPVASSEVDIDQVTVELRSALEELNAAKTKQSKKFSDEHIFLVLDKNLQGIPWESIPILRGRSISRIPSLSFLLDRMALARSQWGETLAVSAPSIADQISVDPRKTYFVLNPSGDLKNTEGRFAPWLKDMKKRAGWDGIIGRAPSEQEFLDALRRQDLVIYFGHGGAEQYIRSHKVRHLQRCAATMLWGCSSGALQEMGDFDRVGTPYHYMLAGCPTLVANLWDVTDRDIDKFSQAVFDKLHLTADEVLATDSCKGEKTSVVRAVAESRDSCKLKYLTGAAPVVYGIPFYL